MAESEVGFANLPNQVHRKAVKKGFSFTLMVMGESGLGKTTFVNALFLRKFGTATTPPPPAERLESNVTVNAITEDIEEKGIKLRLTVAEVPGFCDAINNDKAWVPAVQYIDQQFESYLNQETSVNRKTRKDTRVHALVYFINPSSYGLRPVDVQALKALDKKVNIVPVIAKADTLTVDEKAALKRRIQQDIKDHKISIYQFPVEDDEDEESIEEAQALQEALPFAIVASEDVVEVGGKKVRGRQYGWGVVEMENEAHCDFALLRNILVRTHMQDLKDMTNEVHYENYRAQRLTKEELNRRKQEEDDE
eukprot:comp17031_c0_seq1/m.15731 comp17031_c0_seq1/g.15731  ORF comp17031_c0_seq1/g.15731 comp17031_c0_seq1/m.15731 type:complete len:308 (-) comp17031_c0_seq1:257-1180(-)